MLELERVLEIANQEVGYLEKASNDQLEDKTANAGSNNYTKYAKDLDNLHVYNGIKQGYPWCDIFIDWIFYIALGYDRATELLIGWSAGCTQDWYWFKSAGRIVSEPKRGDLVFFGNCDHIGIIEDVDADHIYTIEGNTSNKAELIVNGGQVAKKTYLKTSKYIKGYARPDYKEYNGVIEDIKNDEPKYPMLSVGSKGEYVAILQNALLAKGYRLPRYGVDHHFGNETKEAVIALQKDAFPNEQNEWDGIVGPKTWAVVLDPNFVKPSKPTYPGFYIAYGQQSEYVLQIQNRLLELGYGVGNAGADAIFGKNTKNAVIAFQADHGLSPDGIVGPATWDKLF